MRLTRATCTPVHVAPPARQVRPRTAPMSPRTVSSCDTTSLACRPRSPRRAARFAGRVASRSRAVRHSKERMSPGSTERCDRFECRCRPAWPGRATVVTVHVAPPARAERHARRAWSLQSTERGDRRRLPCRPAGSGGAAWKGESVARVDQAGRHAWRASPWRAFDAVSTSCAVGGRGWVDGLTERGTKGRCVGPQARSSVVEHYLDTVGVGGSKPLAPTKESRRLRGVLTNARPTS